jgi:hypothetical protein
LQSATPGSIIADVNQQAEYPRIATILQLHRDVPWVGDQLSPEDTRATLHALTSVALAFAKYADLSGDQLVALLELVMDAQRGRPASEGIDEGTLAVLEVLEFKW